MQDAAAKYLEGDLKPCVLIQEREKCNINSTFNSIKKKKRKVKGDNIQVIQINMNSVR